MMKILFALTLVAISVSSQPAVIINPDVGGLSVPALLNCCQVWIEAFMHWIQSNFEVSTTSENSSIWKVLVVSGNEKEGLSKKTEVISSSENEKCALQEFPLEIRGAVGFLSSQGPVVCGGRDLNNFFNNQNDSWLNIIDCISEREKNV